MIGWFYLVANHRFRLQNAGEFIMNFATNSRSSQEGLQTLAEKQSEIDCKEISAPGTIPPPPDFALQPASKALIFIVLKQMFCYFCTSTQSQSELGNFTLVASSHPNHLLLQRTILSHSKHIL